MLEQMDKSKKKRGVDRRKVQKKGTELAKERKNDICLQM